MSGEPWSRADPRWRVELELDGRKVMCWVPPIRTDAHGRPKPGEPTPQWWASVDGQSFSLRLFARRDDMERVGLQLDLEVAARLAMQGRGL